MKKTIPFVTFLAIYGCSIGVSHYDHYDYWKRELAGILSDTTKQFYIDTLITNEKTALEIAEPILASKYGQKNIDRDKPLKALRIDNYWIVEGTLPKGWVGGTATVILRATDSKVIKLTHYK